MYHLVHGGHLTHFGHANIIRHCNRPFKKLDGDGRVLMELDPRGENGEMREVVDVERHDQTIIDNINKLVLPGDTLYHLGDFSFGASRQDKTNNAKFYLDRIKCKNIILVTGNHDPHYATGQAKIEFARLFRSVYDQLRIKVLLDGAMQEIFLNHYAMRVWNKSHHGTWALYGHSHYSLPDDPNSLSIDVGVDAVAGRATGRTYQELVDQKEWSLLKPEIYRPMSLQDIATIMSAKRFVSIDHHS